MWALKNKFSFNKTSNPLITGVVRTGTRELLLPLVPLLSFPGDLSQDPTSRGLFVCSAPSFLRLHNSFTAGSSRSQRYSFGRICQSALTFPDVVLFFLLSDKDLITIQKVFDLWPLKKRPGERIRLKPKKNISIFPML